MKKFAKLFALLAALTVPAVALASDCGCPNCDCGTDCPC